MPDMSGEPGYTLVVCEKPDAARRVAEALSTEVPEAYVAQGVTVLRARGTQGMRYVVCAAAGHLYGISDTVKDRRVYPVADVEWTPLGEGKSTPGRIKAFRTLAAGASAFVNACDLDVEGETIGFNVLRYACGGKEKAAARAKFSSLTREEVVEAFRSERLVPSVGLALAGRLRHVIDFLWGVNLSRALTESVRTRGGFRTISIGRVQGPTLNFVVEKEVEIATFLPMPYWTAKGVFSVSDGVFEGRYAPGVIGTERSATAIRTECEGAEGTVSSVARRRVNQRPPPPFNLPDLQKEAFRVLGYTPGRTLRVAQRLYLAALISYPRTSSQRLPKADYVRLLSDVGRASGYSAVVEKILSRGPPHPTQGRGVDPAHPAIYPTGEPPKRNLGSEESRVYSLIARRLISCFDEDAVLEEKEATVSVRRHEFLATETRTLVPGWMKLSGWTARRGGGELPPLREGEAVTCKEVKVEERQRPSPPRYNQLSLLEKMEAEEIGTKATRADIVSTLFARGYLTGVRSLTPTDLGFALIEAMSVSCPDIISTKMTREVEAQLEDIEQRGEAGLDFYERTLTSLFACLAEVRSREGEIAERLKTTPSVAAGGDMTVLGRCPVCREGDLWVVRSRKSGKRFVGCTNYSKGCRASAPLPQRGGIAAASRPCRSCGWPIVHVKAGRRPWRLCVNDKCPSKVNPYRMGTVAGSLKKS